MMKSKYKIGDIFSFKIIEPDIIIITGVLIQDEIGPVYEMSRIDNYDRVVRTLYGYLREKELDECKYIEI